MDGVLVKNMGSHTNEGASTKPLVTSDWREKTHIEEGGMKSKMKVQTHTHNTLSETWVRWAH